MTDVLTIEQAEELNVRIQKVAKSVARVWMDSVEADEIVQDIWVLLLESPGSLEKIVAAEPLVAEAMLYNLGNQEASKHREAYDYFTGNFNYCVDEVRKLMENEAYVKVPLEIYHVAVADLREALDDMRSEDAPTVHLMVTRFSEEQAEPTTSTERMRLQRGLENLTRRMNRIGHRRSSREGLQAKRRPVGVAE